MHMNQKNHLRPSKTRSQNCVLGNCIILHNYPFITNFEKIKMLFEFNNIDDENKNAMLLINSQFA